MTARRQHRTNQRVRSKKKPVKSRYTSKRRLTIRTKKRSSRFWKILLRLASILVVVWLLSWMMLVLSGRLLAPTTDQKLVTITSGRAGEAVVIVRLDPDSSQSEVLYVPLPVEMSFAEPWDVLKQAGIMTHGVVVLDDVDFTGPEHFRKSLGSVFVSTLREREWNNAYLLFQIWRVTQERGVTGVETVQEARTMMRVMAYIADSCPIGVANTTHVTGAASYLAQVIESQGGMVVRVTNQDEQVVESTMLIDAQLSDVCTPAAELIAGSLPGTIASVTQNDVFLQQRVGIVIVLNETLANELVN